MIIEKEASEIGRRNIVVGSVILGIAAIATWFLSSQPDVSTYFMFGFSCIAALVSGIYLWSGITLVKSGGSWRVKIDHSGIDWSSPNESIDKSFSFELFDIDRIETKIKRRKNGGNKTRYFIFTKDGAKTNISPNSGIDRDQVFSELERLGVKFDDAAT